MICYQTRYEDGVFIGTAQAYPDPLEPDRVVLPGACVATAPPAFLAGKQARWNGAQWAIEPISAVVMAPDNVGLAVSWDGSDMVITPVLQPTLQAGEQASFDGATWTITAAPPPPPPPVPNISRRQFYQQLAVAGIIQPSDAITMLSNGTMPAPLNAVLAKLPAAEQFPAQMFLLGGDTFQRSSQLVSDIGAAYGMTPAQIDAFFVAAAVL